MKPFLILQHRYLDEASNNEFEAILKYGQLSLDEVKRIRIEDESISEIQLGGFSGIILGGGPSNVSDPVHKKNLDQIRFEDELRNLYVSIFETDIPYLGICYGMGSITDYLGGWVSQAKFGEPVGAVDIELTSDASADPILKGVPTHFRAFTGHKESSQELPKGCVHLAKSAECPIQMIRAKQNIYATQFHPELDQEGLIVRINIYREHGYFPPQKASYLIQKTRKETVDFPQLILQNFVNRYRTT